MEGKHERFRFDAFYLFFIFNIENFINFIIILGGNLILEQLTHWKIY